MQTQFFLLSIRRISEPSVFVGRAENMVLRFFFGNKKCNKLETHDMKPFMKYYMKAFMNKEK